jgi:NADPH-dependent curcumin reductase CurA
LIDHFGFDQVINYKTTKDINQSVKEACPDGVDVYYDNVGGEISDAVISAKFSCSNCIMWSDSIV